MRPAAALTHSALPPCGRRRLWLTQPAASPKRLWTVTPPRWSCPRQPWQPACKDGPQGLGRRRAGSGGRQPAASVTSCLHPDRCPARSAIASCNPKVHALAARAQNSRAERTPREGGRNAAASCTEAACLSSEGHETVGGRYASIFRASRTAGSAAETAAPSLSRETRALVPPTDRSFLHASRPTERVELFGSITGALFHSSSLTTARPSATEHPRLRWEPCSAAPGAGFAFPRLMTLGVPIGPAGSSARATRDIRWRRAASDVALLARAAGSAGGSGRRQQRRFRRRTLLALPFLSCRHHVCCGGGPAGVRGQSARRYP